MQDRMLSISSYNSRYDRDKKITVTSLSWDDIRTNLSDFRVANITREQYLKLEQDQQMKVKDSGYYVGGAFDPPYRKAMNLKSRSMLTLDLDHLDSWDVETVLETYRPYSFVAHSSISHTEDTPRLRLVLPLTRDVTPLEYEAVARRVASWLDMNLFDDTTYQPSRVMFLPKRFSDTESFYHDNEGAWIDPDEVLATYQDPTDFDEWPRSDREMARGETHERKDKAAVPWEIPGIIGAFNRAYPIDVAIAEFALPYEESGMGDGRYTFLGGEGKDGAVYYPDDGHLFSHHNTDPAHGNNNAWDLVRIHLFGDQDTDKDRAKPIGKRPSQKAMVELAESLAEVLQELGDEVTRRSVVAEDEFDEVDTPDEGETEAPKKKGKANDLESLLTLINEWIEENGTLRLTREQWDELMLRAGTGHARGKLEDLDVLAEEIKLLHWSGNRRQKASIMTEIKKKGKALLKGGELDDEPKDIQVAFLDNFEKEYFHKGEWLRRVGKQWWAYTGTHWEKISDEFINGRLAESLVTLRETGDKKEIRALSAALGEKETSTIWNQLKHMFAALKDGRTADHACEMGLSAKDPMGLLRMGLPPKINCASGEISISDNGQIKVGKHKPDSLFTSVVNAALVKGGSTPLWDKFCEDSFHGYQDPEGMKRHLEEFMGYCLNQARNHRNWALFYGASGTGKSTASTILAGLVDDDAVKATSMRNYDGANSHATAGLMGKTLLIDDEFPSDMKVNDQFVKVVSEEKRLDANPKGKDEMPFVSRIMLILCSNHPPRTTDTSGALYKRCLVFPFDNIVPEDKIILGLAQRILESERDALFTRFVKGLARLVARGSWDVPRDARDAHEDWVGQSNPLPAFVEQCISMDDPDYKTTQEEIWLRYQQFCRDADVKMGLNSIAFKAAFRMYMNLPKARSVRPTSDSMKVAPGWRGIRVIAPESGGVDPDEEFS